MYVPIGRDSSAADMVTEYSLNLPPREDVVLRIPTLAVLSARLLKRKVVGNRAVSLTFTPSWFTTSTDTVKSTAGRVLTVSCTKSRILVPSLAVLDTVETVTGMQQVVEGFRGVFRTSANDCGEPVGDIVIQYTIKSEALGRPLMLTTVTLDLVLVYPTKFCSRMLLAAVGTGAVPDAGSSTYAAQYIDPGPLRVEVTISEVCVDSVERESTEGAGSCSS